MTIIRRLESLFDIVRLVDPIANTVLELDEQGVLRKTQKHCAAFWDNDSRCANCISARAFEQKTMLNKLEFTGTDHVLCPLQVSVPERNALRIGNAVEAE